MCTIQLWEDSGDCLDLEFLIDFSFYVLIFHFLSYFSDEIISSRRRKNSAKRGLPHRAPVSLHFDSVIYESFLIFLKPSNWYEIYYDFRLKIVFQSGGPPRKGFKAEQFTDAVKQSLLFIFLVSNWSDPVTILVVFPFSLICIYKPYWYVPVGLVHTFVMLQIGQYI